MQTFAQYSPTVLDPKGAFLAERQDWLVAPVVQTRDSGHLEASNFAMALKRLGGEGPFVEVHRFRHWSCGWIEKILVKPDTTKMLVAEDIEAFLGGYAVLDEDDLSRREQGAYLENWETWGADEFTRALTGRFALSEEDKDTLSDADKSTLRGFYETLTEDVGHHDDGGPRISTAVREASEDDVSDFLDQLRRTAALQP